MANLDVPAPFKALFLGWSLIVIVISVSGYSFRWNYYYNFGLQGLVLSAPLESLPVYAIEIARNPRLKYPAGRWITLLLRTRQFPVRFIDGLSHYRIGSVLLTC